MAFPFSRCSLAASSRTSSQNARTPFSLDDVISTVNAPLYVVDASGMDAMLVEAGFITNAAELALLRSEDGQQMLAECIAQGILSQLQAQNTEE